jgi:hypothetical protein
MDELKKLERGIPDEADELAYQYLKDVGNRLASIGYSNIKEFISSVTPGNLAALSGLPLHDKDVVYSIVKHDLYSLAKRDKRDLNAYSETKKYGPALVRIIAYLDAGTAKLLHEKPKVGVRPDGYAPLR